MPRCNCTRYNCAHVAACATGRAWQRQRRGCSGRCATRSWDGEALRGPGPRFHWMAPRQFTTPLTRLCTARSTPPRPHCSPSTRFSWTWRRSGAYRWRARSRGPWKQRHPLHPSLRPRPSQRTPLPHCAWPTCHGTGWITRRRIWRRAPCGGTTDPACTPSQPPTGPTTAPPHVIAPSATPTRSPTCTASTTPVRRCHCRVHVATPCLSGSCV